MENVVKVLVNSDTRMTQHYAKVIDLNIKRDKSALANSSKPSIILSMELKSSTISGCLRVMMSLIIISIYGC